MFQATFSLEETKAYQSIFAKGEAKGEARGEARGKLEGENLLFKHLITKRFGKLPKWAQNKIDAADTEQI